MTASHLFNCKENIVLKKAFPGFPTKKDFCGAMVALKKALKGKK